MFRNATKWKNSNKRWIKSIKTAPKQLMIRVNGRGRLGSVGVECVFVCECGCVCSCIKERSSFYLILRSVWFLQSTAVTMETREGAGDRERERGCKAERKGGDWGRVGERGRVCVWEREKEEGKGWRGIKREKKWEMTVGCWMITATTGLHAVSPS